MSEDEVEQPAVDLDGRRAGVGCAVVGTLAWLLAVAGGAVSSTTVWVVVGVGVGVFLVSNAVRLAGQHPARLTRRVVRRLGLALVVALVLGVVAAVAEGLGAGLLVLGGLAGIILWVASSVVVAAATPDRA